MTKKKSPDGHPQEGNDNKMKNQEDLTNLKQILKEIDPHKKVFPKTQAKLNSKENKQNSLQKEK